MPKGIPGRDRCLVDGCSKPQHAKGYCANHYAANRAHGDPLGGRQRPGFPSNLIDHMAPQVNGCVHFTGHVGDQGYGTITIEGKTRKAHVGAFLHFVGPIPDGCEIDHVCHNTDPSCSGGSSCMHRRCVNPAHLRAIEHRRNVLAGRSSPADNARKTHCVNGHKFTEENTYRHPSGSRKCRECQRERDARRRSR